MKPFINRLDMKLLGQKCHVLQLEHYAFWLTFLKKPTHNALGLNLKTQYLMMFWESTVCL